MQRVQRYQFKPELPVASLNRPAHKTLVNRTLSLASFCFLLLLIFSQQALFANDLEECEQLLNSGQYRTCIEKTEAAILKKTYGSEWPLLKAKAELAVGQYAEAKQTIDAGLKRYSWSLPLRLKAYEIYQLNNEHEAAEEFLNSIHELASRSAWRYTDASSLIALGQASILKKADPAIVLESFYDRAIREYPEHKDAYLASGNLALSKRDFILAQETFEAATKKIPEDVDLLFGLAKALQSGSSERSEKLMLQVLSINPHYIPAHLEQIDRCIHSEQYTEAKQRLALVLDINPHQAEAWSTLAVIAHFEHRPHEETACYWEALSHHDQNPKVDYQIGKALSEHYRFSEGAAYQRLALQKDAKFIPARIQLAQDELRLGLEVSGWEHALLAHQQDGYDTTTFNLLELKDQLASFKTLEDETFIVRMEAREAEVYGQEVLKLLHAAKQSLCKKYGLELDQKITVEIFPNPDDFAVRTFGMPAVSGYLGVCFGKVITANSPASQSEHPTNWQSVLWHEFCHVVTLELTKNKMPRWISEGLSVYEERQKNPHWGETMIPQYRDMILKGETTPISELSSAFLNPKSGLHIQFAYYQSSMVVEYLINEFGFDAMKSILSDLQAGVPVNVAIERRTKTLGELEQDFATYLTAEANNFASEVDWSEQDLTALTSDDTKRFDDWIREHPHHFQGLMAYSRILEEENRTAELEATLKKLVRLYPQYTGADNACLRLAALYQKQERFDVEQSYLEQHAKYNPNALAVFQRLATLYQQQENWHAVYQACQDANAINPLDQETQQRLATACIQLNRPAEAVAAYQAILALEPHNPAETHYQLARLLQDTHKQKAKRHTLIALEQAPRFRAAHQLLLELTANTP
ncbi:peptidase MA family metallohydrolase [Gimesia sp.]|uniref:peptidase MA family metallohydrolase n=1 Tax=Gimesia sp. TaxID=2024833 RepID=UPI003A8FF793